MCFWVLQLYWDRSVTRLVAFSVNAVHIFTCVSKESVPIFFLVYPRKTFSCVFFLKHPDFDFLFVLEQVSNRHMGNYFKKPPRVTLDIDVMVIPSCMYVISMNSSCTCTCHVFKKTNMKKQFQIQNEKSVIVSSTQIESQNQVKYNSSVFIENKKIRTC